MRLLVFLFQRLLPALDDRHHTPRFATVRAVLFQFLHDILSLEDGAKDHVLSRQPLRLDRGDKELRSHLPGRAGRRQHVRAVEFGQFAHAGGEMPRATLNVAVNALAARAVAVREIATLQHKIGNDAVELRSLVAERLAGDGAVPLFASGQGAEIFRRLGGVLPKQSKDHLADALAVHFDFKVNAVRDFGEGSV